MCASRLRPGRGPTTGARARLRAAILGLRTRGSCAAAFALAPAPAPEPVEVVGDEAIEPSAAGPLDDGATLPGTRSVRIARIDVIGNDQVPARIILDPLQDETLVADAALLWPEDPRVERARQRLLATGNFERVTLKIRPLVGDPASVVLIVAVEERSSINVTDLYLGSSRMTAFRGGLQVRETNFLGRSIHIGGGFIWGTRPAEIPNSRRQQGGRFFIEAPRIEGANFGLVGSFYMISASEAYRVAGELDDPAPALHRTVDYSRIGGTLGVTIPLLSNLSIGADYGFERVNAFLPDDPVYAGPEGPEPVDLSLLSGVRRLTSAHLRMVWDGRDRALEVGKGGRFALDVQLSSPLIGSEYEFIKIVAGGSYTFRLPWRHWITPSIVAGQIAGRAPRFERFYAGDLQDWTPGRELGLIYSTRGPFDVFGTGVDRVVLGDTFGRIDIEYVWPLFTGSRVRGIKGGHLFLSTGVFTIAGSAAEKALRRDADLPVFPAGFNANLGLRLDTVIGTFDLSVGNVLRRLPL